MTKRRATAIVRLDGGRLIPVTQWDAELLEECKAGQEFDLAPRSRRSTPHNSMYWACLARIAKATDAWPTPEHLHRYIKFRLGYVETIRDPAGNPIAVIPDSTAFDKMPQDEFNSFFARAMRLMEAEVGFVLDD